MGGDIGKVSRAGAVRILQHMNYLCTQLSYRSTPEILTQEFRQDLKTLEMILSEMNPYPVRFVQNEETPWGSYRFAPQQVNEAPQTEPEMESISSSTQPLAEFDYDHEVEHFIEVLNSMDKMAARKAIQLVLEAIRH